MEKRNFFDEITKNKIKTFFMIILFVILVLIIGFVFSYLTSYGIFGLIIAVIIAVVMSLTGYYNGDKMVLSYSHAKPASKQEYPYYFHISEALAIAAGTPPPKIYVIQDEAINAFATGRDPKHASIAVTSGALRKLNREELEGVIAHEMSHVKNFDIRLMTITGVLIGIIVLISEFFLRSLWFGGGRDDKGNNAIFLFIGIALAILSPIMAQIIKMSISRKREYLADATGAMLTRNPGGLASALKKISNDQVQLQGASNAYAHLYISNPFKKKRMFTGLFSTHPPLGERIKRLEAM